MEISKIITLLNKTSKILSLYKESDFTLEETLDDIYKNLKLENLNFKRKNADESKIDIDKNMIIEKMNYMDKREIINYLSNYKKNDLLSIADVIGIKISRGQKNEVIIENISNFFAFNSLNKDMSNRDSEMINIDINNNYNSDTIMPIGRDYI